MKKIATLALAAIATTSMMAASPALAAKEKKANSQQSQVFKSGLKATKKGIRYQPTIVAGSKNWIKRLNVGRGPGYNGGFTGHPGGL